LTTINVGIAGLGTVAQGVLALINRNAGLMQQRSGVSLRVVRIASRRARPEVDLSGARFSTHLDDLLSDPDVDLILELIGGEGAALDLIRRALAQGTPVVTANKAVLAAHGNELLAGAGKQLLRFEASVAGAIPIIQSISNGLAANRLHSLFGIINGTCNYIFGKMESEGTPFDQVLAQAQALGYAEADPGFDIDGIDAAHKLTILLALGFTGQFDLPALHVEGIQSVTLADIEFAKELGYKIKHLGIIQNTDQGVEARVHPALVPMSALLANVNGVMNAVQINSDGAGETLFSGPGAGGEATASAVLSDALALGQQLALGSVAAPDGAPSDAPATAPSAIVPMAEVESANYLRIPTLDQPGVFSQVTAPAAIVPMAEVESANYLRIPTLDQPGVFAQVTKALSEFSISIDAAIQHDASKSAGQADIVLLTNHIKEQVMNDALAKLQSLDIVAADIVRLRVAPAV